MRQSYRYKNMLTGTAVIAGVLSAAVASSGVKASGETIEPPPLDIRVRRAVRDALPEMPSYAHISSDGSYITKTEDGATVIAFKTGLSDNPACALFTIQVNPQSSALGQLLGLAGFQEPERPHPYKNIELCPSFAASR